MIYKYPLSSSHTRLELPWDTEVLTAQMQRDRLVLWAKINPIEVRMVKRVFVVINTGHEFEDVGALKYLSTATSSNGIVWHVFEVMQ